MRKRFERLGIYGEKLGKYNKNMVKMPYLNTILHLQQQLASCDTGDFKSDQSKLNCCAISIKILTFEDLI